MPAIVRISRDPLDAQAVRALEEAVTTSGDGGVVTFQGVVRDNARGKQVRSLEYDAYIEMAEQQMAQIAAEVETRWEDATVAMVHRIGRLEIGECSVVVPSPARIVAKHSKPAATRSIRSSPLCRFGKRRFTPTAKSGSRVSGSSC